MKKSERAERFIRHVGWELKGKIASRGRSAKSIAEGSGHSTSALSRWLNGKNDLPLAVLYEVCEMLDVDAAAVLDAAIGRMAAEDGEG